MVVVKVGNFQAQPLERFEPAPHEPKKMLALGGFKTTRNGNSLKQDSPWVSPQVAVCLRLSNVIVRRIFSDFFCIKGPGC